MLFDSLSVPAGSPTGPCAVDFVDMERFAISPYFVKQKSYLALQTAKEA